MTWIPNEKEIASVIASDGRHRYEYFIHRVCETRAVWALYQEGWASVADEKGDTIIPFWPHQAYATAFASGGWASFEPRKIDLQEFLASWIPGMKKQGVHPAIFPVAVGGSVVVSLDDLEAHLRHELDEVHGIADE